MKTVKGTARKLRRADITVFKALREKKLSSLPKSTHHCNFAPKRGAMREGNPHLHDVATVCAVAPGLALVTTWESTTDFPANVPCFGRAKKYSYGIMGRGAALQIAAKINQPNA